MSGRIQINLQDFVKKMVEVQKPPQSLVEKLNDTPFCHLLSTYVIRPVACDENPFIIHHKNKQPMFVSNKDVVKAPVTSQPGEDDSSSDNDFETVQTDKKRV